MKSVWTATSKQIHVCLNGLPHCMIRHLAQVWGFDLGMEESQEKIDFNDAFQCFVLGVDFIFKK